jgi:acetoin:2,6-dichlorophenolindophenol oxidoreductase subunit alpha
MSDVHAIDHSVLVEMYRRMRLIRSFEETVIGLVDSGELLGTTHSSIGQEGAIVGACIAVRTDDYMTGTHRSHGHPIAKGAQLPPLMAELLGKRTGVCKGKGGSMHLADFSVGSLGESGIVASALPVATGAGLSARVRRTEQVCLCFFGDGAVNEGAFHESLNLAAIWQLPVIYLCENNGYAVSLSFTDAVGVADVAIRAEGYGIPGTVVDGQDVVATYAAVRRAADRARAGEGPTLVEAKTYRYGPHAAGLVFGETRPQEEIDKWMARDPIAIHRTRLLEGGSTSEAELAEIDEAARVEVASALQFARESPYPDAAEAFDDLYAQPFAIAHG